MPPSDKKKEKSDSKAITLEKAKENALLLQKAVATLMLQARDDARVRQSASGVHEVAFQRKKDELTQRAVKAHVDGDQPSELKAIAEEKKKLQAEEDLLKANVPPIIHPLSDYGYHEGKRPDGHLKKFMSDVKEIVNRKPVDDGGGGGEFLALQGDAEELEKAISAIQDGWLSGQPVETSILKDKVAAFEKKVDALGVPAGSKALTDFKELLAAFPETVETEVDRLKGVAQTRVYANETVSLNRDMLKHDMSHARMVTLGKKQGACDFLKMDLSRVNLKDPLFFDNVPLHTVSDRAYILVEPIVPPNEQKILYVDKTAKIMTELTMTPELKAQLEAGDTTWKINPKQMFSGWALRRPADSVFGQSEILGEVLTPNQEKRIAQALGHDRTHVQFADFSDPIAAQQWQESNVTVPTKERGLAGYWHRTGGVIAGTKIEHVDWKEVLPHEHGDTAELNKRKEEEKKYTALCGDDAVRGAEMARDKALERLISTQDEDMIYDSGGAKFNVSRKKNDDGAMVFSVKYQDEEPGFFESVRANRDHSKYYAQAMTAMIDCLHRRHPLSAIELDCEDPSGSTPEQVNAIIQQLEHAVAAAEASSKRGGLHVIGLVLSDNVKAALLQANNTTLQGRVDKLYEKWKIEVKQKQVEKEESASAVYTADEKGLSGLLHQPIGQGDALALGGTEAVLGERFKAKGNLPADQQARMVELEQAVTKLEMEVNQQEGADKSITDRLYKLKEELGTAEVKENMDELNERMAIVKGLQAAQERIVARLELIGGSEDKGSPPRIVENYQAWLNDPNMRSKVGADDQAPAGTPAADAYTKVVGCQNKVDGISRECQTKMAKMKATDPESNLAKLKVLEAEIKTLQAEVEQKRVAAATATSPRI